MQIFADLYSQIAATPALVIIAAVAALYASLQATLALITVFDSKHGSAAERVLKHFRARRKRLKWFRLW